MSANIKTAIHHYCFDTSKPEQAAAYAELLNNTLLKIGFPVWTMNLEHGYSANPEAYKFMDMIRAAAGTTKNYYGESAAPVELETKHLFDNQWNSAAVPGVSENGLRLFNWSECKYANRYIIEGYWLEQTAEMREILRNTHKCGYCGKQEPAAKGYVFCPHCLDSEYLEEKKLHLTRMIPVCDSSKSRAPLSEAERAHLLPLYREAQKNGTTERGKKRITAARRRIETEYKQTVADAKEKRDAAVWIMDNAPGFLDNWIYYSHQARHYFGWRSALDSEQLETLLSVISEFPFAYEIKCADGRTLQGY